MTTLLRFLVLSGLLATFVTRSDAASGTGTTTRYWDCCKPSCAWNDLEALGIQSSVKSCNAKNQPLTTNTDQSACNGGSAYMCSDQSPWAINDTVAFGFAAVNAASPSCCQCYQLKFTSGSIEGKTMIVQATNTGSDVGSTQFDIAMPGGGFGIFDGCTQEWGATSNVWGAQYGGSSSNTCSQFPSPLQAGCGFRWDWFEGEDNPNVEWETVSCPSEITEKSGCIRVGDTPTQGTGGSPSPASSSLKPPPTSKPLSSVSTVTPVSVAPSSSVVRLSSIAPSSFSSVVSSATRSSASAAPSQIPGSVPNNKQVAWGQCGGQNWSGATSCISGYACREQNPYYSQCLPETGSTSTGSGNSDDDTCEV